MKPYLICFIASLFIFSAGCFEDSLMINHSTYVLLTREVYKFGYECRDKNVDFQKGQDLLDEICERIWKESTR